VKRRSSSEEALALLRQRITELEASLVQHEQSAAAEQQAAEQYATMLATTSDGFWRVDRNGKLQDVNEAYCRMSGYSREELLQMSIPHLEAVESADSTARHIRKLIEDGSDRFETKHRTKSGRIIDVEVSATYLPSRQELIVFVRSISDQKLAEGALRRGEARYRSLFENMLDGFAYCQMLFVDERPQDFVYLEVNSAFERLTGLEDVVGRKVSEVIPGIREVNPELLETYGRVALTGERERFELYLKPLGTWLLISAYSSERGYFAAVFEDITDRKLAEGALRQSNRKVQELHRATSELAACVTEDEVYQLTVRAAEEILDLTLCTLDIVQGDKLVVKATSKQLPPGASTESSLDEGLAGKTYRTGKTCVFGSLDEVPEAQPTREEFRSGISAPIGDLGVFQVVSVRPNAFTEEDARLLELLLAHTRESVKRIRLQKELEEQAIRDPLTSAYNRRYFNEAIEQEVARSKRYGHPIAFLMVDVNRFKEINDRFGHRMGDQVLRAVADVLRQNVRMSDTVIRYGGDEFLVILPETNGNAEAAVERIHATVAGRNVENSLLKFPVTLAIGVDHWQPTDPRPIEVVLSEADRRMYEDKKRNRE